LVGRLPIGSEDGGFDEFPEFDPICSRSLAFSARRLATSASRSAIFARSSSMMAHGSLMSAGQGCDGSPWPDSDTPRIPLRQAVHVGKQEAEARLLE
jgi:hypothetical protein